MTSPFQKTLRFLAKSNSPHVATLLIATLDRDLPANTLKQTVSTLLNLKNKIGHQELIRCFKSFDTDVKQQIREESHLLANTLQQGLKSSNEEHLKDCLELVQFAEIFNKLPVVLDLLLKPNQANAEKIAETFSELINSLSKKQKNKNNSAIVAPLNKIQQKLDKACSQFDSLHNKNIILKSILILGTPEHISVQNIFKQKDSKCCQIAIQILKESKHPGVMQLLVDSILTNYSPLHIKEVLRAREDTNFIIHLLRWVPLKLNENQERNFFELKSLSWLSPNSEQLEQIPPELHEALAKMISFMGLPPDIKRSLQEWMIQNGSPAARRIAADVLLQMKPEKAQEIVQEGLDSDDKEVQAWSVGQLRSQNVPDAMKTLISRLEDDSQVVRDAARNELQGFNLEYIISNLDKLTPAICLNAGQLIQKIDQHLSMKLETELRHPIYHRRLQTLRAIAPLGMTAIVRDILHEFLEDDETLIRRLAIETLALDMTDESLVAIISLADDPSPRIRAIVQQTINVHYLQSAPR